MYFIQHIGDETSLAFVFFVNSYFIPFFEFRLKVLFFTSNLISFYISFYEFGFTVGYQNNNRYSINVTFERLTLAFT